MSTTRGSNRSNRAVRALAGLALSIGAVSATGNEVARAEFAPSVSQVDLTGPPGSSAFFGTSVTVLTNGNYVVVDSDWDLPAAAKVGAVHLYDGANNTLISTITGSTTNDRIGSSITPLSNGNFVIGSRQWDGAVADVGAVTWGNGVTGVTGTVSSANSLVGTNKSIAFGGISGAIALTNGNYLVAAPGWNNGAAFDAGAVVWGDGNGGVSGEISTSNSLYGTTSSDRVGNTVVPLSNGNYVVGSSGWGVGGAATWANGATGISGPVSTANSLYGPSAGDGVGHRITALTNGNYVVNSTGWNGPANNVGAVTWGNGTIGTDGPVTTSNSLHGTTAEDQVGSDVIALANGNYAVNSYRWDGSATDVGAVTWGNGNGGTTGPVTMTNSLYGTTANDRVGQHFDTSGLVALTNGNYIVASTDWDNGATSNVGAVTLADGSGGTTTGPVSPGNSLHGATANDGLGSRRLALSNGNYVVGAPGVDLGGVVNVGAAVWGKGTDGPVGPVTTLNSLHGTTSGDEIGSGGFTALANGNFVVLSPEWSGPASGVGAVTWASGEGTTEGPVTTSNSLHGTITGDLGGSLNTRTRVTPLDDGNYVVGTPLWNNGGNADVGAATWSDGNGGTTGAISTSNSLHGTTPGDQVGRYEGTLDGGVVALAGGNYVVHSALWDNGGTSDAGAVTFGLGSGGLTGPVTASNSVIGTPPGSVRQPGDRLTSDSSLPVPTSQGRVLLMQLDAAPSFTTTPPDVAADTAPDATTATVTYTIPTATDLRSTPTVGCIPASGSAFAVGNTTVTCTATDSVGLTATTSFTVTVTAIVETPPSFATTPPDVSVNTAPGATTATVTYSMPTATDIQSTPTVTCTPPSGSAFSAGNTTVTCTATDSAGLTATTSFTVTVTAVPFGADLVPVDPARLLETRFGPGLDTADDQAEGDGPVGADSFIEVQIAGRGGIPSDAVAAVLNVTAINPSGRGFVTIYPCGTRPLASSLNYAMAGAVVGNEVIAKLSPTGTVCAYTSAQTHLTFDTVGYAPASTRYRSLDPTRLVETRFGRDLDTIDDRYEGDGRLGVGTVTRIDITGRGGIPAGAAAAVLNVTAINPSGRGFITIYPCGDRPLASSLNYAGTGAVVGNEVVAKLSGEGEVCIFSSAETDLTLDAVGYVLPGINYSSLDPVRLVETRFGRDLDTIDDAFEGEGRIAAGTFQKVQIAGRGGVPASATAAVLNVTAINPSGRGFITIYPCGDRPLASSLNYASAGAVAGNEVVAKLSTDGSVCVFSSAETDLTIDAVGLLPS